MRALENEDFLRIICFSWVKTIYFLWLIVILGSTWRKKVDFLLLIFFSRSWHLERFCNTYRLWKEEIYGIPLFIFYLLLVFNVLWGKIELFISFCPFSLFFSWELREFYEYWGNLVRKSGEISQVLMIFFENSQILIKLSKKSFISIKIKKSLNFKEFKNIGISRTSLGYQ